VSATPLVQLAAVTRRFGTVTACENVSFALDRGAFLTILGPSGSGKTTVLRMIAGFMSPTSGDIRIQGQPVAAQPPWRRSIGMVFQRLALFPHLTAAGNVAYPLRMRGFPKADIAGRVEEYLRLVRLDGLGARRIHELSGGQQQRVAIARALVFRPDLLLLDEPLAALDRKLREDMQLEFRRLQRELGVTTINVTHDQREALVMSDRVVVMSDGRVQQDATPAEIYDRPANRFVASFIGLTNLIPGRILPSGGGRPALRAGDVVLEGRAGPELRGDAAGCAAIRAERIGLAAPGQGLETTIAETVFEGERTIYECSAGALGDIMLRVVVPHGERDRLRARGEALWLSLAADDVWIFPDEPTNKAGMPS
jgi:putative spermidine/putrescine transport system ATP-binding protein